MKPVADVGGTVGVGYHVGKRRYFFTEAGVGVHRDIDTSLLGVDADISLTKFIQLKGEYYSNKGAEDGFNGLFPGVFPSNPPSAGAPPSPFEAVTSRGYWGQLTLKPIPAVWLAGGYGNAKATRSKLSATAANTRYENEEIHGALIFNASKTLRMSLELAETRSKYVIEGTQKATQASFGTQLLF